MADFDFASEEVLKALIKTPEKKGIEFVGSAISHFQSEPIMYDKAGTPLAPLSDWEFELSKNLAGKSFRIKTRQDPKNLPRFLAFKDRYLKQSKNLGENMFRFSLDFGRLCPSEGKFNTEIMAEYVKLIALIKSQGQEPMITLHHFTMPKFLMRIDEHSGEIVAGGWEHPDVLKHFRFYIENVVKFLNDKEALRKILIGENYEEKTREKFLEEGLVRFFMTFNEPAVTPIFSYITGIFPPYRHRKIFQAEKILRKMALAHDIAYEEIKKTAAELPEDRKPKVGLGYAWPYFDGIFSSFVQKINTHYMVRFERDGSHSDFIGVHYYFRKTSLFFYRRKKRDYSEHPSFGDIYPRGILNILRTIHSTYPSKEIFISEIGFADSNDHRKPFWLAETLRYIISAKKEGVPIRALLLWSLVNNFEWELGMDTAKFGLFSETELDTPLAPTEGKIRSWEVWQSAVKAISDPTPESLRALQACYQRARDQYVKYENRRKTGLS